MVRRAHPPVALQAAADQRALPQLCHCADIRRGVVPGTLSLRTVQIHVTCRTGCKPAVPPRKALLKREAPNLCGVPLLVAVQVKRKLLRPCISLTKAVRSEEEGSPEVDVDVDTLTFDRRAGSLVWTVGTRGVRWRRPDLLPAQLAQPAPPLPEARLRRTATPHSTLHAVLV